MDKGISYFFGYREVPSEKWAKMIKDSGFDCVITSADEKFEKYNGSIDVQMQRFKDVGLKVSSLHNRYDKKELFNFWLDNEIGDRLEKTLIEDLDIAHKYGFKCVVVHMLGEYSQVGEARLKRVLAHCRKVNVPIAVENVNQSNVLFDIFKNVEDDYLKFCYDCGHNHCYDPEVDYLDLYGDKLVCLHLHDNDGTGDQHTLAKFGTIDWQEVAKRLAKLNLDNISLDYEMIMYVKNGVSAEECLAETIKQAKELDAMITYYKSFS